MKWALVCETVCTYISEELAKKTELFASFYGEQGPFKIISGSYLLWLTEFTSIQAERLCQGEAYAAPVKESNEEIAVRGLKDKESAKKNTFCLLELHKYNIAFPLNEITGFEGALEQLPSNMKLCIFTQDKNVRRQK